MAQTDRNGVSTEQATPPSRFTWRGGWVTGTEYIPYDVFRYDGASYITLVDHTAGVFSTDLASDFVELFADKGLSGSGSGDMIGANNGGEFTDPAAVRTNIGAAKSGANTDISSLGGVTVGTVTATESVVFKEGAAVASATTTEVWGADGNTRHVTGSSPIGSFGTAPQAGATMRVIFDGTPLITDSANLVLNAGGEDIQIEANDWIDLYADTTTALRGVVHRASGVAVKQPAGGSGLRLLKYTVITATDATWAKQAGTTAIEALCVGGGGAGGGADASGECGFGGMSGEQVRGYLDTGLTSTFVATIGAAGTGVSGGTGNSGTTTSFTTSTPTTIASALGGLGGRVANAGGGGSGANGERGVKRGGAGNANAAGSAAGANSGAGGGGASSASGSAFSGGNGGTGIIYVWEYG